MPRHAAPFVVVLLVLSYGGNFCVAGMAFWQHEPILAWQAWDFSNMSSISLRRRGVSATWPVGRNILGSSWIKMCRLGPKLAPYGTISELNLALLALLDLQCYKNHTKTNVLRSKLMTKALIFNKIQPVGASFSCTPQRDSCSGAWASPRVIFL